MQLTTFIIFQRTRNKSHTSSPDTENLVLRVAHTVATAPGSLRGPARDVGGLLGLVSHASLWILCLHIKHVRIISISSKNHLSIFSLLICVSLPAFDKKSFEKCIPFLLKSPQRKSTGKTQ